MFGFCKYFIIESEEDFKKNFKYDFEYNFRCGRYRVDYFNPPKIFPCAHKYSDVLDMWRPCSIAEVKEAWLVQIPEEIEYLRTKRIEYLQNALECVKNLDK